MKQKPRLMQSSITNNVYYVTKYKEISVGKYEAIEKRLATPSEIYTMLGEK